MPTPCPATSAMHIHHARAEQTLAAVVELYADISQFSDPDAVLSKADRAGFAGRDDAEILVGQVGFGVSFCDPLPANELGGPRAPDFAERLNDQRLFDPRVPGLAGVTLDFLPRLDAPWSKQEVCGLVMTEHVESAPGLDPWDIFDASLTVLSTLVMPSRHGLLFLHSAQDLHESQESLWRAMAEQNAFRKEHPCWQITTFPSIGPMEGVIAGLIPAGGSSRLRDAPDPFEIGCSLELAARSASDQGIGPDHPASGPGKP